MENKQDGIMMCDDQEFMDFEEAKKIVKKLEKEDVFIREEEEE